jgi:anti-sigma regulatory factor (Ser/Thr protein kinase)
MFPSQMSVVVESRLECVPLAGALVRAFCFGSGLSDVQSGQIEVAIMEAANNSVAHAYQHEAGHPVGLVVSRHRGSLHFEVWDEGRSMDPEILARDRSHLLEIDPDGVERAPERGRGLAMMKAIMDSVEYSVADGRNRFRMTKRILCESVTT